VINKNKNANSGNLKAQYRWLFIKACLYAYLKEYSATLTDSARQIASDDAFFYMSDMKNLADCEHEVDRAVLKDARFVDLKNNLSAWANSNAKNGYIYNKIILNSKDQA